MSQLVALLPMAFVMIAGPQIVTAVFLATSTKPIRNSLTFLTGVALAVTAGVTASYWVAKALNRSAASATGQTTGPAPSDWIVLAGLLFLAVRVFLKRGESEPPKWMAKLQSATPGFSFLIGFLLFMLMPTDIIGWVTVGASASSHGLPWVQTLAFVALTVLLAAVPLLIYLLLGKRAQRALPKVRTWMIDNAWIINEVVIAFFLYTTISGMVGA